MGPSRISLKEERINNLEAQVEAHKTKISLLHQRLASALDELDYLQNQHLLELDTEVRKRKHVEYKLRQYMDTVQAAEVERDDLRDAVIKLVVKVESGNIDFSSWPRSHMQLSSLLDPVVPTGSYQLDRTASKSGTEDQLLSYAGAIIDTLRDERDLAIVAHAHTRETYEARIHTLEAQLARRDAELEACGEHVVRQASSVPREEKRKEQMPIPQEEIMTMLQRTTARNKTLEEEIKRLFKRLEQARTIANSASQPSPPPDQPCSESPTEFRHEANAVQALDAQFDPPLERSMVDAQVYSTPSPHSMPAPATSPASSTTSPISLPSSSVASPFPSPRSLKHHADSQSPHGNLDANVAINMAGRGIGTRHSFHEDHNNHRLYHNLQTAHLDHQIAELSAQIDAFRAERQALWQVIASRRDVAGVSLLPSTSRCPPGPELEPGAKTQPPITSEDDHNRQTAHLDHQIVELSAQIDAFRAERHALWQVIASQHDMAGLPSSHGQQYSPESELELVAKHAVTQPPITLEDEYISLRYTVRQLRTELLDARASAEGRERELLQQIELIGRGPRGQGLAQNAPTADLTITQEDHFPTTDDLLDAHDGEMSMDLATPLFPISLSLPSSSPHHSGSPSGSLGLQAQSPNTKSVLIAGEEEEEGSRSPRMIRPRILPSPSRSLTPQPPLRVTSGLSPVRQPLIAPPATFPPSPGLQVVPAPFSVPAGFISTISVSHATNMEQVERELTAEQLRLQQSEQQLAELQNMLRDLYEQQRVSSVR